MQASDSLTNSVRTGWSGILARAVGGIFLFEVVSGLAITFGPFHPSVEWGVLAHTIVGLLTIAPLVWYVVLHWKDYISQALSDVLLLGYVAVGALGICVISGVCGWPARHYLEFTLILGFGTRISFLHC